jgi:hypothetical protein
MNIGIFSPGAYGVFFNELISKSNNIKFSINNQNINWYILTNTNIYLNHFRQNVKEENICYLFENFNKYMNGNTKIDLSSYNGSIYRDILTDKHTFFTKRAKYQLKNACTIYRIWKEFLQKVDIQYIVFPDVEYVEGMILLSLCKELNIKILYYVHARNIGKAFFAKDVNEQYYQMKPNNIEIPKINIDKAYNVTMDFNQSIYDTKMSKYKRKFIQKLLTYIKNKTIYEKHYLKEDMSFIVRFRSLFLSLLNKYRASRKFIYDKYVTIKNKQDIDFKYIYFPLQVTPESSINNLEPYFVDQLRAIDLLLMNINSDIKIIIKEHPAFAGERDEIFYKKLSNKPGVEIASLNIDSKELIKDSVLVSSITGTALLEAMLQDKSVFQFGKTFFYQDDFGFDSFGNMRKDIQEIIEGKRINKLDEIISQLQPLLFDFYIELPFQYYYQPKPVALMDDNLKNTLKAITFYITNIENGNMK